RNVRPAGAAPDEPAEGAVAVLWLPEHAPTNTGSYPMLPDRKNDETPSPRNVAPKR
ncbi:two-component sensor histidine kinase, partial [Streptomyces olivaceus]